MNYGLMIRTMQLTWRLTLLDRFKVVNGQILKGIESCSSSGAFCISRVVRVTALTYFHMFATFPHFSLHILPHVGGSVGDS